MSDYPFNTWKSYFYALTEFLNNQHYYRRYPKYGEQHENPYIRIEIKIIETLLKYGADPQEGLDGFLKVILKATKYVSDIHYDLSEIIDLFIKAGAKPDVDSIFALKNDDFKEEVAQYKFRGLLVDIFSKYALVDKNKYYNWSSIEGKYFDDIDQVIIENDYEKACFMVLKNFSEYLQTHQ